MPQNVFIILYITAPHTACICLSVRIDVYVHRRTLGRSAAMMGAHDYVAALHDIHSTRSHFPLPPRPPCENKITI